MQPPAKKWVLEQIAESALVASGPLGRTWRFLARDVWRADVEGLSRARRALYRACRVLFLTARSFAGDRCLVRAAALTYTTVLSIVPLLALAFAALKGLGYYEELRATYIDRYLDGLFGTAAPLETAVGAPAPALDDAAASLSALSRPIVERPPPAPTGVELRRGFDQVLNLVDRTDLKGLGFLGLTVLIAAVLRLLGSIEGAFNEIWGVTKSRAWVRKLSDYVTIVVAVPLAAVIAIGAVRAAQSIDGLESIVRAAKFLLPMLSGWALLALAYLVMPNRRQRFASVLLGSFAGALAWQLALVVYVQLQIGLARWNAIYASFTAIPLFLFWVQTSWLIVLAGAELAFAHESEPSYRGFAGATAHSQTFGEQLALRAMTRLTEAFLDGRPAPSAAAIAASLGLAPREVQEPLAALQRAGLAAAVEGGESAGFLPARDPARIAVADVLGAMRGVGVEAPLAASSEIDRHVDRLIAGLEAEQRGSAYNRTLRDLVLEARRREAAHPAAALTEPRAQPS